MLLVAIGCDHDGGRCHCIVEAVRRPDSRPKFISRDTVSFHGFINFATSSFRTPVIPQKFEKNVAGNRSQINR
jgi:hypothetical protein